MADMVELKNIVRKGIVQSVDEGTAKARVKFGDKGGIVSGALHILVNQKTTTKWLPEIGSMVLCLMIPDGDGEGYILGKVM
jgi:Phage P2 baseplate assembly protein gpV